MGGKERGKRGGEEEREEGEEKEGEGREREAGIEGGGEGKIERRRGKKRRGEVVGFCSLKH